MKVGKRLGVAAMLTLSIAATLTLTTASNASADVLVEDFESFTPSSPGGQHGWQFSGPHDVAIDDPTTFGVAGMGNRALRISNASTSDAFNDWAWSKSLTDDAGETSADGGTFSGGNRQDHFEASFKITSTQALEQPGLQFSLAPDRGDGARMSFLRFNDTPGGIDVTFSNYLDKHQQGDPYGTGCNDPDAFVAKTIATGLPRTEIHDVRITMDFLEGPANDRVEVYINDALVGTGTSWEDYFRYCEGNETRPVDSLIFQARTGAGTAVGTLGEGFLIDDVRLTSGSIEETTPPEGEWNLYPEQSQTTSTSTTEETTYRTRVRPPINADGTSNWPKKRGVIPVQFELDAATKTTTTTTTTTGPAVFESIGSDTATANDYSFLSFAPDGRLALTDLTELVADYEFLAGDCHGGSLRWQVSLDTDGDGSSDGRVHIYYGNPTEFGNGGTGGCTSSLQGGVDQTGDNLIGLSDARYDTTQFGGPFYDTYGGTLSLLGEADVVAATLALDSGWGGDQRVDLDGATVNGTHFALLQEGSVTEATTTTTGFVRTCDLPQAEIKWTKNDPVPDGAVNEQAESVQLKDTGQYYRQVDCKYIYNLDTGSLGAEANRKGTYFVYAKIDGVLAQAPAKFDLK